MNNVHITMIYIYSIKGILKLEKTFELKTVNDLKRVYINKYPEFKEENIQIFDEHHYLLYEQDSIESQDKFLVVIRPIPCECHK